VERGTSTAVDRAPTCLAAGHCCHLSAELLLGASDGTIANLSNVPSVSFS